MKREKMFAPEEWDMLTEAPLLVGLTVSDIDQTGSSSIKEFENILKSFEEAKEKYRQNELIQTVLEYVGGMSELEEAVMPEKDIIEYFRDLGHLLDTKYKGTETYEYKQFLYWIAWRVANAYGEGFLGLGDKVSISESYILEKIREALGV